MRIEGGVGGIVSIDNEFYFIPLVCFCRKLEEDGQSDMSIFTYASVHLHIVAYLDVGRFYLCVQMDEPCSFCTLHKITINHS